MLLPSVVCLISVGVVVNILDDGRVGRMSITLTRVNFLLRGDVPKNGLPNADSGTDVH